MQKRRILRSALVLVMAAALALGLGTVAFAAVSFSELTEGSSVTINEVILKSRDDESLEVSLSSLEALSPLWADYSGADISKSVSLDRAINDKRCELSTENGVSEFLTNSPTIVTLPSTVEVNKNGKLVFYGVALGVPDGTEVTVQYGLLDANGDMPEQPKTLPGTFKVEDGVLLITVNRNIVSTLCDGDSVGIILTYKEENVLNVFMSSHTIKGGNAKQAADDPSGTGTGSGSGRGRSSKATPTPAPTRRPRFGIDVVSGNTVVGLETDTFNWWNLMTSEEVKPVMRQILGDGTDYINIYGGIFGVKLSADGSAPQFYLDLDGEMVTTSGTIIQNVFGYLEPIEGAIKSGVNIVSQFGEMVGKDIVTPTKDLLESFFH